jgi:hypothetical protein
MYETWEIGGYKSEVLILPATRKSPQIKPRILLFIPGNPVTIVVNVGDMPLL